MVKRQNHNILKLNAIRSFTVLFILIFSLMLFSPALSREEVPLYFFWGDGCPHCHEEKDYLDNLVKQYPQVKIYDFETWKNRDNVDTLKKVAKAYNVEVRGVPATFIGSEYIPGFGSSETTGKRIELSVKNCIEHGCVDPFVIAGLKTAEDSHATQPKNKTEICVAVFIKSTCEHCQRTLPVIEYIKKRHNVEFPIYDVLTVENKLRFESFLSLYSVQQSTAFPTAFVTDKYLVGDKHILEHLENEIIACKDQGCPCPIGKIPGITPGVPQPKDITPGHEPVVLPIFGELKPGETSLLLFTFALAVVDGVNPCTMWVLSFLLGILLYSGSRRRIIFVGSIYLITVYLVYFLFMVAWLNTFLIIGYIDSIRITIGLIAVIAGAINIKDFFWYGKGISLVIPQRFKPFLIKQMRNLTKEEGKWALFTGSAFLAAAASLIELPCTAGFPAVFTQILTTQNLDSFVYYAYIALYCAIYIIPDATVLFIFLIFMQRKKKFTEKEGRWLKLSGGLIMLILGLIMLLKPNLLQFA